MRSTIGYALIQVVYSTKSCAHATRTDTPLRPSPRSWIRTVGRFIQYTPLISSTLEECWNVEAPDDFQGNIPVAWIPASMPV